ncbi:MAG: TonB-dependent receptor [Thermoanaerobaculia bacterium]
MRHNSFRILLLALIVLASVPSALHAQGAGGSIAGVVVDTTGASIPGATVTVRHLGTSAMRTAISNGTGNFTFALLPVGPYELTAALAGFETARVPNVVLNVGGDITLKIPIKLSGVAAEVTVSMEAPLVETTRSQVSSVVNERFVANLPTNGRNFIDFVLTTPGVTKDSSRVGDISFAGQRGTLNSLVVDGADNNNNFFGQTLGRTGSGRAPYQFSQDAVQEFQVNTNAYSAEYGRAGGAVINVVTKSGTNDFHGTLFEFYRDKSLNANDYVNVINGRVKGPYHFDQFGASLGGPIVKDKVFFFASYDGQRNTLEQAVILNTTGLPTDPDTVAGLATLQALGQSYGRGQNQDVFFLKADGELSEKSRLSMRYNHQSFTGNNQENGGTSQAEEHSGNSLVKTDTVSGSFTTSFSSTVFDEFRAQYAKDSEPGLANSTNPEATIRTVAGGATFLQIGRNSFSPRETTINKFQIADTATFIIGNHTAKAGFDFNKDNILNFFPGNFGGVYNFNTIASFNRGKPSAAGESYLQAFAGEGTSGATTNPDVGELGIFVQDEFRATPNLTINAGLRYDYANYHQPSIHNLDAQLVAANIDTSVVPEDSSDLGVRLGVAYTPKGIERTVFRAGYGMFYGRTPAIAIGTAHSQNAINVQTLTFTGANVPTYPNAFLTIPTGGVLATPTIFVFDKDYRNPLVHQASAGVEHGLSDDFSIGLAYLFVKGTHLQRSADINLGTAVNTPYLTDSGETVIVKRYPATRPFTNFRRIIQFQSTAESNYNGLTLDLQKRFSHNWQARIAYTYSKVLDTKPDATAVVAGGGDDGKFAQDSRDFGDSYGPGDADQRHRLVISGYWALNYAGGIKNGVMRGILSDWALSGILTVQSGQPYSAIIGTDINNDLNSRNDRAPGFGRNTFNYETFISLDPRITKEIPFGGSGIRLQLIAEAFNLLNRSNVTNSPVNGSAGVRNNYYALVNNVLVKQTNFGDPLASAGPRIVQLAAKLIF